MKMLRTIMDYLYQYRSSLGHLLEKNWDWVLCVRVCVCVISISCLQRKLLNGFSNLFISQINFIVIKFHFK